VDLVDAVHPPHELPDPTGIEDVMNAKLFTATTVVLSLIALAPAFAGMPDAYRVAPPSAVRTARPAAVRPYALTGDRDAAPHRQRPWQQHLQRIGTRTERIVFTR
jgi:hypothetical protein